METNPIDNHFELNADLTQRIRDYAKSHGISPTRVVHNAVEEYLFKHGSNRELVARKPRRPLAEIADSVTKNIPDEEWAKQPADLAKNFNHYRYGYPRED